MRCCQNPSAASHYSPVHRLASTGARRRLSPQKRVCRGMSRGSLPPLLDHKACLISRCACSVKNRELCYPGWATGPLRLTPARPSTPTPYICGRKAAEKRLIYTRYVKCHTVACASSRFTVAACVTASYYSRCGAHMPDNCASTPHMTTMMRATDRITLGYKLVWEFEDDALTN